MSSAMQAQLYGLGIMVFFIGMRLVRGMRPREVQPNRILISGGLICVAVLASLVGTGGRIINDPVAIVAIPVFAGLGVLAGYYLVRSMRFWTDEAGKVWMQGGALFIIILLVTIAVRFGARALIYGDMFSSGATPAPQTNAPRWLLDLSADLLFISLGLWAARAYFILLRHRAATPPAA